MTQPTPPESQAVSARALLNQLVDYASRPRCLIGASLFRVLSGFAILVEYLLNYKQRHYLFGPDGLWPWEVFSERMDQTVNFSVYSWSRSSLWFETNYHLGIVVGFLWLVGWQTRWLTPLNFYFWYSLHQRISGVWDGGDNLMQLALSYAVLMNVGEYFSLDSDRAKSPSRAPWVQQVKNILHNAGILACALQISLVYGIAGLCKIQGDTWRDGTALYYAFRGGQFIWPGISELIYQNWALTTLLSYATVAFQISFPFLLFLNRRTRVIAVFIAASFHLGIALLMGLITFSIFMMATDLILVDDDEYLALGRASRRMIDRMSLWRHISNRPVGVRISTDADMGTRPDRVDPASTHGLFPGDPPERRAR